MFEAVKSPYLVSYDGQFRISDTESVPRPPVTDKKALRKELARSVKKLDGLQRRLYADNRHSVLLIFQAMDAAGKDGTIRAVMSGINPAGCQVYSFKKPSENELDHDFLWRTAMRLPERGRIGIFNRSYYEEVLVVRVHPGILDSQRLPWQPPADELWQQRLESIRDHEKHLARNGTVILKFWLNVSREEQGRRFLARLDQPEKHWKFSTGDVRERGHWDAYMAAYEQALNETSRPWAPWYAIPADNKPHMRASVAEIIRSSLGSLDVSYPTVSDETLARFGEMREILAADP